MSNSEEVWRNVYGFDVLYEVSNKGRVRTRYKKKVGYTREYTEVVPLDNGKGYLRFNWRTGGKQRTVYLHKLVAEYFVDNPNHYAEVNHKDENKSNNDASNLEWCTHVYNCNYGTRNKRSGESRTVRVVCVETGIVYTLDEAARKFNVVKSAICNCINGKTKTSCGYTWRRADVE